jgi:hypothetical protein
LQVGISMLMLRVLMASTRKRGVRIIHAPGNSTPEGALTSNRELTAAAAKLQLPSPGEWPWCCCSAAAANAGAVRDHPIDGRPLSEAGAGRLNWRHRARLGLAARAAVTCRRSDPAGAIELLKGDARGTNVEGEATGTLAIVNGHRRLLAARRRPCRKSWLIGDVTLLRIETVAGTRMEQESAPVSL